MEFIAPLHGGPTKRDGSPKDTALVAGVTAQTLRHVDLLLEHPWSIELAEEAGFPVGPTPIRAQVPNPASFIAQKLLVLHRRPPAKRAKDVLYIHDTLRLFADAWHELHLAWERVSRTQHARLHAEVVAQASRRFDKVDDLAREAADIAAATGRAAPPSPEQLVAVCRRGTARIFGGS